LIWRQKQRSGDGSTNIQAQVVQYGVSYSDAKAIAMDVFKENFAKLSQNAHRLAVDRADEFTMNYLSELQNRKPEAIQNIEDPGVQSDILEAQSGFAKSGDTDLGQVLVDILVDRTARTERTTASLALSAAVATAQKLTGTQFAALTAMFIFKQLRFLRVTHHEELYRHISFCLEPLRDELIRLTDSDVQYLAALGCITISVGSSSIHETLQQEYPGIFSEGFDFISLSTDLGDIPETPEVIVNKLVGTPVVTKSLRDPEKIRVAAAHSEALHQLVTENGCPEYEKILQKALTARPVSGDVIMAELREHSPATGEIADVYNAKSLSNCTNTAIGTAIAHANLRKATEGKFSVALDVWLS
jgi:hypothetical protein